MSYGDDPAGEQGYDTGQTFGAPPPYPGPPGYGQPGYGQHGYGQQGYGQPGSAPPTYRTWAAIAMVCGVLFSLILGFPTALVARRFGQDSARNWAAGDVQAAIKASRRARAWVITSFVLDVIGIVLLVLTQR